MASACVASRRRTCRFHQDDAPAERPAPADETEQDGHGLEHADDDVDDDSQQPVLGRHAAVEARRAAAQRAQAAQHRP